VLAEIVIAREESIPLSVCWKAELEMLTCACCSGRGRFVSRLSSKERREQEKTKRQCHRIIPKMATHVQ